MTRTTIHIASRRWMSGWRATWISARCVELTSAWRMMVLTVLTLGVLCSCSKETTKSSLIPQDGIIRLSADVTAPSQTKNPLVDGGAGAKIALSDINFLRKDGTSAQTNFSGISALSGSRDVKGEITFATPQNYDKAMDNNAYFVAYWPSKTIGSTTTTITPGEKVVWSNAAMTDILISTLNPAEVYDAGKYSAPKIGTMTFKHVLAQLTITVKATPTTIASLPAVQAMWGKILRMLIQNTPKDITYTNATNSVTYSNVSPLYLFRGDYISIFNNFTIQPNTYTAISAAGMYAPVKGGLLYLRITTEKFPDGIEIPVQLKDNQGNNCDFEAGKRYAVTLIFGADDKQIDVESTIEQWDTGYTGQGSSGWVSPAIGDFYYTDGTWSATKIPSKTLEGVVYWVNAEDPMHFKIITPTSVAPKGNFANAEGKIQWSTSGLDIATFYPGISADYVYSGDKETNIYASGRLSGVANRVYLEQWLANPMANPTGKTIADFPAFKACDEYGDGWFLPATNELQHFYCAYAGVAPINWEYSEGIPAYTEGYPEWWFSRVGELNQDEFIEPYFSSTLRPDVLLVSPGGNPVWGQSFHKLYLETHNDNTQTDYCFVRCIKEVNPLSAPLTPMVEDYYYADGTWSRNLIPGKTPEGVIYWVDPANPEHFKVVSMDDMPPAAWDGSGNVEGKLPWGNENNILLGKSMTDGKANTLKIMQYEQANEYKAAKWCFTKNAGVSVPAATSATTSDAGYKWYLPADVELLHLFCSYWGVAPSTWGGGTPKFSAAAGYPAAWNARFAKPFMTTGYYSGSTDFGQDYSYVLRFSDGNLAGGKKSTSNFVRCVMEVGAPVAPAVRHNVGDYYYSDGSFSRDLDPDKSLEGVIFWIEEWNPKHFKIVSMDEPPAGWDESGQNAGKLPWASESVATLATSLSDGKNNTLSIMQNPQANKYKAAKWCHTRNVGMSTPSPSWITTSDPRYKWYLPAKDELQHLFCAYWGVTPRTWDYPNNIGIPAATGYPAAWNARFFSAGVSFSAENYWISTDAGANVSWRMSFVDGTTVNNSAKGNPWKVRCIRDIVWP